MTTQTLSSVSSNVVDQYSQVGKLVVGTCRTGAERLVTGATARYAEFLNKRSIPMLNDEFKASLVNVHEQMADAFKVGITNGSNLVDRAIEQVAGGLTGGIQRIAAKAERVETAFETSAIRTVGSLSMPVAEISLKIANRAVASTERLSARLLKAEGDVVDAASAIDAEPATKKASRAVKAAA